MIDEIRVRNVALIREATLRPSAGLTVLTGETGAGKTALISACKLLAGERADRGMVREGEPEACVEGRFFLREAAGDDGAAADSADAAEEREVVAVRRLTADGRSRVTLNGDMSSVTQLARDVAPSVDLCGQHEHQLLLRTATHVTLLDAWAGDETGEPLAAYRTALAAARTAAREHERVCEARTSSSAALDEARFTLRQIDAVGLVEGEYEELLAFLERTEHAETLARAANGAHEGLSGDGGALDGLNAAIFALDEGARFDAKLGDAAQALREAGWVLEDVAREMIAYRDEIEFDPAELARAQERAAALQGLMRSYGPRMEDVAAKRDAARELVSLVDDAEERERAAAAALAAAEAVLAQTAARLHEARIAAAPRFAAEVSAVMARLEMGTAQLLCEVSELPRNAWTNAGSSSVEFLFRPGAGMQARPLARIASGGEVSRVMLAVHAVLGERDRVSTLVFDEVDAGVGGAVASALAGVLADLARTHQVIAITHLAQVASRADTHYVVEKSADETPETALREVTGEARVAEIARMLSGTATQASLAHAAELLGGDR